MKHNITKNITFFALNNLHQEAMEPLKNEAAKRGYDVQWSSDLEKEAEIGFYSQHTHKIPSVNSDLSIIMFHGVDQGYTSLLSENWSRFDIGLLPGRVAAENWRADSAHPSLNPNIGVFCVGWPKSDMVFSEDFDSRVDEYKDDIGIQPGITTLYAPTIENDNKIDDYVNAVNGLVDNILIKHAPYEDDEKLRDIYKKYEEQDNVYILEKNDSIFHGLAISDLLVSDQSSVIQEAILTDTISISVTDWVMEGRSEKYPGSQIPSFTLKIEKNQLKPTIRSVIRNYDDHSSRIRSEKYRHYANLGKSTKVTLDIIDCLRQAEPLPINPLSPKENTANSLKNAYYHSRYKIAKEYHKVRFQTTSKIPDRYQETLLKLRVDKLLELLDKVMGKKKYR